jgi:hypothetical protein
VPKPYPKEFRDDVVAAARKGEAPLNQIAKDFGISQGCLHNWMKKTDVEDGARPGSLQHARSFIDEFVQHYNHEHRHTGIGLHTPADVHYGLAQATSKPRESPGRGSGGDPAPIQQPPRPEDPPTPRNRLDQHTHHLHRTSRTGAPHHSRHNSRWPQPP